MTSEEAEIHWYRNFDGPLCSLYKSEERFKNRWVPINIEGINNGYILRVSECGDDVSSFIWGCINMDSIRPRCLENNYH